MQSFWYPCTNPPYPTPHNSDFVDSKVNFSTVGTFFLALLFTSREEDEIRELQGMMESYRWILRIHSRNSPGLTDLALSRLDSLLTTTTPPTHDASSSHNCVLTDTFLNGGRLPPGRPMASDDIGDIEADIGGDMGDLDGSPQPSGFAHELPRPEFGQVQGSSPILRKDIPLNDMAVPLNAFVDFDFEHWMREALLFGGDTVPTAAQNEGIDLMYSL